MRFCSEPVLRIVLPASLAVAGIAADVTTAEVRPSPRAVSVVRADIRTGRLVRSIVVTPRQIMAKPVAGKPPDPPKDPAYRELAADAARNLDVNPMLVDSVIQVESNYNPYAISPKGAQGLMQLMPATARRFGVKDTFDARQNIEGGVRYLKFLQDKFKDERLAIAAYNAGENAVVKYGNVPPYAETMGYVAKVGRKYGQARRAAEKNSPPAKPAEAKAAVDEPKHVVGYVDQEGRLHIATR